MKKGITVHWSLINRLASRRFGDTSLAEEAALFVLDRLEENDCARLQAFSGKSSFSTYIASVSIRILEDFARKKFGRVRPPGWLKALGGLWTVLFHLLCLERLRVPDAVETVIARGVFRDRDEIETAAWSILERIVHCGKHQGLEVSIDEVAGTQNNKDDFFHCSSSLSEPEKWLQEDEQRTFLHLLFHETLDMDDHALDDIPRRLKNLSKQSIELSTEDKLLLQLCFKDNFSVSSAGKMLGLNANQVHGRLRRLLSRMREEFTRQGISDDLQQLLQKD